MLGEVINDLQGLEGSVGSREGLNLLPLVSELTSEKTLTHTQGQLNLADQTTTVSGYEIHVSQTRLNSDITYYST
ncbi:MAG: adenosylcobyric acid synthase [Alteromonadaceae bacterium]|jgi:adenosylcobyric acid synthase